MSDPFNAVGPMAREVLRFTPTYTHLISTAVLTIFAGAHASLVRPSSAARRPQTSRKVSERKGPEGGLTPADAIYFPLATGCMLAGLYALFKWLDDPRILNSLLNWYLSIFGAVSTARLLSDSADVAASFVFPARWQEGTVLWKVDARAHQARSGTSQRDLPLPAPLSRLVPEKKIPLFWRVRDLARRPLWTLDFYLQGQVDTTIDLHLANVVSLISAALICLWFNLVSRPWWMTNLLGFGFGYQALQMISPTTFWTATLVLTSLFFYDIYFVFYTPMMITVAKKLDIPVKFLFPRPPLSPQDTDALAMLGLGDVVIPGIVMALALRFDLYLHYRRKQQPPQREDQITEQAPSGKTVPADSLAQVGDVLKATYILATGSWGERAWIGNCGALKQEGGSFPKTYFYASVGGYVIGLLTTVIVMSVFKHGQPALLYLVPSVLGSLWGTAAVKGDFEEMWAYSEDLRDGTSSSKALESKSPQPTSIGSEEESRAPLDGDSIEVMGKSHQDQNSIASPESYNVHSQDTLVDFTLRLFRLEDSKLEGEDS